jgi:predicted nucleic acid-binding protein
LLAPQLWPVEFASVLRGLERRRLLTSHNVDRVAAGALGLEIALDPAAPLRELITLSRRFSLSGYDAAYLEVAIRRGVPLATRDSALARAARAAGMFLS